MSKEREVVFLADVQRGKESDEEDDVDRENGKVKEDGIAES